MITVYSKPNCMACTFTKKFLEEKDIAYTSYDVISKRKGKMINGVFVKESDLNAYDEPY